MRRKNIIVLALITALATTSLVGCGSDSDKDTSTTTVASATTIVEEVTTTEPETTTETETTHAETTTAPAETTNKTEEPTTKAETPTGYTYTELSQTMYAKSSVNVRKGPEASHERLGGLSKAEAVEVTGKCTETGWYKIKYKGSEGFVSGSYLVSEKPETTTTSNTASGNGGSTSGSGSATQNTTPATEVETRVLSWYEKMFERDVTYTYNMNDLDSIKAYLNAVIKYGTDEEIKECATVLSDEYWDYENKKGLICYKVMYKNMESTIAYYRIIIIPEYDIKEFSEYWFESGDPIEQVLKDAEKEATSRRLQKYR